MSEGVEERKKMGRGERLGGEEGRENGPKGG